VLAAVASSWYAGVMMRRHPGCGPVALDATASMLVLFAPQIVLYGLAVWASSLLAAHRRFAAAAAAPLVSTVVVIASYLGFAAVRSGSSTGWDTLTGTGSAAGDAGARLGGAELAVLAGGTTIGVLALAVTVLVPVGRLGLRVRPRWRFPDGLGRIALGLAAAGVTALAGQQLAMTVLTWVGNHRGSAGTVTLFGWVFAVFAVPFAVLLAPIATSTFPRLAASDDDPGRHESLVVASTRMTLLAAACGSALLAGTALPVAAMFTAPDPVATRSALGSALLVVAPGLLGYGLLTLVTRILAAGRRSLAVAVVNTTGWVAVVVAAVVLVGTRTPERVVVGLAGGLACGLTMGGLAAVVAMVRDRRFAARRLLPQLVRPLVAGLLAAAAAGTAGHALSALLAARIDTGSTGLIGPVLEAAGVGVVVLAIFGTMVLVLDRTDARRVLRVLRPGPPGGPRVEGSPAETGSVDR